MTSTLSRSTFKNVLRSAVRDLVVGLRTPLNAVSSSELLLVGLYAVFALAVGFSGGILHPESPSWFELVLLPPLLVIYPSLIEESVFRGLLLPRRLRTASIGQRFVAVSLSTALFVLMHPVNAWFFDLSDTSQFFTPAFLIIVTALGYTCGYLYLRSGSLWAPILVHWATVVSWNLFLGRDLSL